jgi:DnaJ-domain-containing protein 1
MPETIKAARIVETYYTRSYTMYRNLGGQAPGARDSVHISKEALEKFRRFKENQNSEQTEEQAASTEPDLEESLNILQCTKANPAQVRKAYLSAINRYHPDKFANMPPEFRKLAEEKTKEINTAYDRLRSCIANI